MPAAYCFLSLTLQKLLGLVQPAFLSAVFVCGRGFDGVDAGLHRTGRLLLVAKSRVGSANQIQTFGIIWPPVEKSFQRVAGVAILASGQIGCPNLAPNLVLRVRLLALHYLLEVADRFGRAILLAGNASELIMRIQFIRIYINRALKTFARLAKLTSLLMN